jgi:hypothetical protein
MITSSVTRFCCGKFHRISKNCRGSLRCGHLQSYSQFALDQRTNASNDKNNIFPASNSVISIISSINQNIEENATLLQSQRSNGNRSSVPFDCQAPSGANQLREVNDLKSFDSFSSLTHPISSHHVFPSVRVAQGLTLPDVNEAKPQLDIFPSFTPTSTRPNLSPSPWKPPGTDFKLQRFGRELLNESKSNGRKTNLGFLKESPQTCSNLDRSNSDAANFLSDASTINSLDVLVSHIESSSLMDVRNKRSEKLTPCFIRDLESLENHLKSSFGSHSQSNMPSHIEKALSVYLRFSSISKSHLCHFFNLLFRYFPNPPAGLVAECIRAARILESPNLGYAVVAQLQIGGLVGALRALDQNVFYELIMVACTLEKSVPRVIRILHDMARIGLRPCNRSLRAFDSIISGAASGDEIGTILKANEEESRILWESLIELNFTRYFVTAGLAGYNCASRHSMASAVSPVLLPKELTSENLAEIISQSFPHLHPSVENEATPPQ